MTANKGPVSKDDDCPARGPALAHTPSPVNHTRCRHCGALLGINSRPAVPEGSPDLPPLDVAARLRMMGLMPDSDPLNEAKWTTGLGPQGSEYGPGRTRGGNLSEKDKRRLDFYVNKVRARDEVLDV